MDPLPQESTDLEVAAITARLPLPHFRRILDVCCGSGRHAAPLSAARYEVTGIDRDETALAAARQRAPDATFHRMDQRAFGQLVGPFDAALLLWQSFGYFAPDDNDGVLRDIATLLRPGGRFLLDLFHPEYFRRRQGRRSNLRPGVQAIEDSFENERLRSRIVYEDGSVEWMDFEVFAPEQIAARAKTAGLDLLETCCWWDAQRAPDPDESRYQVMFERRSS
jgi:SAM-dependent methyltransferase